jgi:hypothetical protein
MLSAKYRYRGAVRSWIEVEETLAFALLPESLPKTIRC